MELRQSDYLDPSTLLEAFEIVVKQTHGKNVFMSKHYIRARSWAGALAKFEIDPRFDGFQLVSMELKH